MCIVVDNVLKIANLSVWFFSLNCGHVCYNFFKSMKIKFLCMDNILLSFSLEPLYLVQVLLINVLHIYYFQQVLEVKYVMPFHMISVNLSWICQHNLILPHAKILMHAYQMAVLILIAKIYGLENLSLIWSIWPGYGNKICNKLYLNLLCKLFLINETRTQSKLKMRVFPQFH